MNVAVKSSAIDGDGREKGEVLSDDMAQSGNVRVRVSASHCGEPFVLASLVPICISLSRSRTLGDLPRKCAAPFS